MGKPRTGERIGFEEEFNLYMKRRQKHDNDVRLSLMGHKGHKRTRELESKIQRLIWAGCDDDRTKGEGTRGTM